jgi:hypothetical protein
MCVSGESTSLSCNNLSSETLGTSVPGEQGPPGPEGPKGPPGPEGPDKEFDTIIISKRSSLTPGTSIQVGEAICPDGTQVTGGGYGEKDTGVSNDILEDRPIDNGWRLSIVAQGDEEEFTVYAVCGKLIDPF